MNDKPVLPKISSANFFGPSKTLKTPKTENTACSKNPTTLM